MENARNYKPKIEWVGRKFGHWNVIAVDKVKTSEVKRDVYLICECDCGCGVQKTLSTKTLYQTKIGGCGKYGIEKVCLKCQKTFFTKRYGHNRTYCFECMPEDAFKNGATTRKYIKKWAIDYKGGCCSICGYNKCNDALDFHHLEEDEKDFCISDRNITMNWQNIKKELDKCILVCANCHREIHAKKGEEN